MFEFYGNKTVEGPKEYSCGFCDYPCSTCGDNSTDCLSCIEGYMWYDLDHTCYEIIEWPFPFACAAAFFILFCWMVDCCYRETNILHSLVYFLGYLEDIVIGYWLYKFYLGEVTGDRMIAFISFGSHVSLNFIFIFVHLIKIVRDPTPQY